MATSNSTLRAGGDAQLVDTEAVVSFVAAMFDDVQAAKQAYITLKDLSREGFLKIVAAAYMEKTDRNRLRTYEYKDWRAGQGMLGGGAVGAVVGLIGSTILLPAAVGALIGGTLRKVHDTRFGDKDLHQLAESLTPGTSALITVVEAEYVAAVEEQLLKQGGQKVHSGEVPPSAAASMAGTGQK